MQTVHVIQGPNLHMLGIREPAIYGTLTLETIQRKITAYAQSLGVAVVHFQSNLEGELIEAVYQADKQGAGILINPAGYSHSSVALRDAMLAVRVPIVEVHLSNLYTRELFRQELITAGAATQVIIGGGVEAYLSGLRSVTHLYQFQFLNEH